MTSNFVDVLFEGHTSAMVSFSSSSSSSFFVVVDRNIILAMVAWMYNVVHTIDGQDSNYYHTAACWIQFTRSMFSMHIESLMLCWQFLQFACNQKESGALFSVHSTVVVDDDDCCWLFCSSPINPIRRDYCIWWWWWLNNLVRWSWSGDDDENWELFARFATITAITTFTLMIFFL